MDYDLHCVFCSIPEMSGKFISFSLCLLFSPYTAFSFPDLMIGAYRYILLVCLSVCLLLINISIRRNFRTMREDTSN